MRNTLPDYVVQNDLSLGCQAGKFTSTISITTSNNDMNNKRVLRRELVIGWLLVHISK